jgi:hypothetical protein
MGVKKSKNVRISGIAMKLLPRDLSSSKYLHSANRKKVLFDLLG